MDRTQYYREIADRYLNLSGTSYAAGYQRNRFETFSALLPQREGLRIFDFGCGSGDVILELTGRGHDAAGSDLSPEMLQKAREKIAAAAVPPRELYLGGVEILTDLPRE